MRLIRDSNVGEEVGGFEKSKLKAGVRQQVPSRNRGIIKDAGNISTGRGHTHTGHEG